MSSYRARPSRPDRAKAIAAVVAVHAAMAAMLLMNTAPGRTFTESLPTVLIDIAPPPPPPPPPPPTQPKRESPRDAEGAAGKKAEPTEIVAPPPRLPAPTPVAAAPVAGTGTSPNAGAANAGNGPGAGGSGNGRGGGGTGDFSGYTPARLVRNVGYRDYSELAAGRLMGFRALVGMIVQPDGSPDQCRIVRSTGDPSIDAGLCPILMRRLRFRPALDDRGTPIRFSLQYVATWSR